MDAFAIYRLPHADDCTLVGQNGAPATFASLTELGAAQGFVIAPFTVDDRTPVLLLRADEVRQCTLDEVRSLAPLSCYLDAAGLPLVLPSKKAYRSVFDRFHQALLEPDIQKLVLARCEDVQYQGPEPTELFSRACERYPEAFVTLFSAPQCGTWLLATPEVLLARDGNRWRTMALAGTMRYTERLPEWSEKNVQEQAYVARYINDCLSRYSHDVTLDGPYTTRAASLVHLRTDFSFTLPDEARMGDVLADLHPTPAVCGMPKEKAQRFIVENEHCDRSYYSGFSGPLNLSGDTALFVSLRCMRILEDRYRLYAGGGILPQSEASQEWSETVAKMQAMISLIS